MSFIEVMAELESLGTETNRKIYKRHGSGENVFGVSFANLGKLTKRIKQDHELAAELWQTGNADARQLATMIANGKSMPREQLDAWLEGVEVARDYGLAAAVARNVAAKSPDAIRIAEAWIAGDGREYTGQAGWELLALIAMQDKTLPDAYFDPYLEDIEARIHDVKNRVRYAMNMALIAIGLRSTGLRAKAEAAGARIGIVLVDHGETGCKTPDAVSYIAKSWARKKTVAAR